MIDALRTLAAWRRQRFDHGLFVPVALTLVVASTVGTEWPPATQLFGRAAAAWLGVLALRLWDDLEDRRHDADRHPERVLTQIASARPYAVVVTLLLAATALWTLLGGGAPLVWLGIAFALLTFYRLRRVPSRAGDFAMLLKYPSIVVALGSALSLSGLAAAVVVLAAVGTDEVLQAERRDRRAIPIAATALIAACCGLVAIDAAASTAVLVLQSGAIAGMGALLFLALVGNPPRKLLRLGLLALTFIALLSSTELVHAS